MEASAPPSASLLRSLTDHLDGDELCRVLNPFHWVPLHLEALKITVVETAQLFMPGLPPQSPEYGDLMQGLLHPEGLGSWMNARTRMIRSIARISFGPWVDDPRENAELFTDLIIEYLTKYVLRGISETIIRSYRREETPRNFTDPRNNNEYTLSYREHSSTFYPRIAVVTSDGEQLFTVVAPLYQNGYPTCQLVGYLLGVAQRHFSEMPSSSICALNLIRLTDGPIVYFAKAWVTRAYLTNVENGMVNEIEEGLNVYISDAFDLSVVAERARFIHTLADMYQTAHDNAGPMPPLHALELE